MTTRRSGLILLCGLVAGLCSPSLHAQKKSKQAEPYALIRGTVFQDSGISQPGAKVVLSVKGGKKLQEQMSSPRGEFAFRVPVGPGEYVLTATLKGFDPVDAAVTIEAQEQVNKNLLLPPASNKKK